MDELNNFLSDYNKRDDEKPSSKKDLPVASKEVTVRSKPKEKSPDTQSGFRYEQKSGFKPPKRIGGGAPPTKGPDKRLIIGIGAGAALLLVVLILILVLTSGIKVIGLVGRPLTEAQLWAGQNGLNLQTEDVYSDEVEAGVIISQETPEGSKVRKGDFVYVTSSLGPDLSVTLTLPDLLSMTKDEVDAWAAKNFMTKVRVTTEFSNTVPSGQVIRYEINDNTVVGNEVRRDTPIYVIVSKGIDTTVEQIELPDFKTMALSECYAFATENGLVLVVEESYDDYAPEGSIVSQSVKAKEKVPEGTEIKLVVSKGKKIEIPDFSDYTKELAASVAAELGIPVTIMERYSGSSAGAFISQSLPAGTIYEKGDFLELHYSLGNKIVVPSFVGQTRDAIENWAMELNEQGARIKISAATSYSSSPAGTIIQQSPSNTSIGVSKTINITVSKGKVISVPDFTSGAAVGYDVAVMREQAIEMCAQLNLVPKFVSKDNSAYLWGAVFYQSLAPGAQVTEGTQIELWYRPVSKQVLREVPDFVGKSAASVMSDRELYKRFNLVFEVAEDATGTDGQIIRQSIVKGQMVSYGTTIVLYTNPSS